MRGGRDRKLADTLHDAMNFWAAEVKHDGMEWLGQLRHLGHWDRQFGIPEKRSQGV
jgi:hypothetical protein